MEVSNLTNKKVYHKPSEEIIVVKKDYSNGELLFNNGVIGKDDDIIVMEETETFIQSHQYLLIEFDDLLNSDPNFNYSKDEFIEWFFNEVLTQ